MNCKNRVLILLRSPSMLPALRPLQHHKHSLICRHTAKSIYTKATCARQASSLPKHTD